MLTDSILSRLSIQDLSSHIVDFSGYEIKDIELLSPHQRLWVYGLLDDNKYRTMLLEHIRGLYEK